MSKVSSKWYCPFRCVWPGTPKLPKIKCLLFLCSILPKKELTKSTGQHETYYKLIRWFWCWSSSISKVSKIASLQCFYNISKIKLKMEFISCMQINIKVACKLIQTLWAAAFTTRWLYHYWWAWWSILKVLRVTSLKIFAISQEVRNGKHFLHVDKHQRF